MLFLIHMLSLTFTVSKLFLPPPAPCLGLAGRGEAGMGGSMSSQELPYSLSETLLQGPSAEEGVSPASWMPDPAREVIERTSHGDPYLQALGPLLPSWSIWSSGALEQEKGTSTVDSRGLPRAGNQEDRAAQSLWPVPVRAQGALPPPTSHEFPPRVGHPCAMCLQRWLCGGLAVGGHG